MLTNARRLLTKYAKLVMKSFCDKEYVSCISALLRFNHLLFHKTLCSFLRHETVTLNITDFCAYSVPYRAPRPVPYHRKGYGAAMACHQTPKVAHGHISLSLYMYVCMYVCIYIYIYIYIYTCIHMYNPTTSR